MNKISLPSFFTVLVLIGTMGLTDFPVKGQTSTSSPTPNQQSAAALALNNKITGIRQQVLANNPTLKAEEDSLLNQLQALKQPGPTVTVEMRQAIHEKWVAHENNVRIEAVKIDPSVAAYF